MGSCFSKKENEEKEKLSAAAADSREPPAPESPQEEEKVKEVLSETPKRRPSTRRTELKKELPEKTKKGGEEPIGGYDDQRSEDTLDVYSVSESFSASTPSLTEQKKKKKEEEEEKNKVVEEVEEEQKRRVERSPARRCHHQRKRSFSGELQQPTAVKVGCRSGRSSPSPPVGRTHSAREAAAARTHRLLSHSSHHCEKFRRDHSSDRSVRRSLSPAKKLAAGPDHRGSNGGGQCRGLSARCSPQRAAAAAAAAAEGGGGGLEEESLENPLVSLECFIFL